MAWNNSKVKMWRRCQKQYAFRHDYAGPGKELVPKVSSRPLSLGTWMHALQEAHHRGWAHGSVEGLSHWEDVHEKLIADFEGLFDEEKELLGDLPTDAERLFRSYLRRYKTDVDLYTPARLDLGDGLRPAIEVVVEVSLQRWGFSDPFKGRLDLIVEDNEYGGLWIWDAKWVKRIPDFDDRMLSPQALLYAWALLKMGVEISGFLFNYGRTKPPSIPRVLKKPAGMLSIARKMDTDFITYVEAIKRQHGEQWRRYAKTYYREKLQEIKARDTLWFRRERIPVERARIKQALQEFLISAKQIERREKPDRAPRTWMPACRFDCSYRDLCAAEFMGLDIEPLVRARYKEVNERYMEEEDIALDEAVV